jgi:hypothetical protein
MCQRRLTKAWWTVKETMTQSLLPTFSGGDQYIEARSHRLLSYEIRQQRWPYRHLKGGVRAAK